MMALSKCVLDRVSERKNELKGRMYGLVEIMSRSVFARMDKRTSLYKDLLDQLVDDVFNKFSQELNEAWRDGCAHGLDLESSQHQHINQDEENVWDSEIQAESLSISTLHSQASSSPEPSLDECIHLLKFVDPDDDDDDEEYYSIMAPLDGVDQCVLDRIEERKNNFKSRAYRLVEIMSRTVFARMVKRTSVYKDLLDQLVEQVFNKFTQELNDAWRDGCAYGRDEWNVYSDFGDLFEDQPEMNNLDLIEPLSSQPQHSPQSINKEYDEGEISLHQTIGNVSGNGQMESGTSENNQYVTNDEELAVEGLSGVFNSVSIESLSQQQSLSSIEVHEEYDKEENALQFIEDSSLHSSPTQSQPSSQSQHENILQHEEQVSNSGVMSDSVPISSSPSQASSPQQSQECKLYEEMDDGEYIENNCNDDNEQCEEYDRNDQISANDEKLSLVNGQVDGDGENDEVDEIDGDYQNGVDQLNGLEHRNNNIDGNESQKGQLAQNESTGQVAVSDKSPTGKLTCEHCGKGYKTRHNLTVHIRTHTGDRPFKCPKCHKTFYQNAHMKQHIASQHDKIQIDKYACSHCPRRFTSQSKLENHISTHTGERPHKCPFDNCNKAFSQLGTMQGHYTRVHTEVHRPYVCEHCGKGFKTSFNLALHLQNQIGELANFKCHHDSCDMLTFVSNCSLQQHINISHLGGMMSHVCEQCGKGFGSPSEMIRHMRTHTGEKPYKCPFDNCNKAFSQLNTMKLHHKSHTGQLPHACAHCTRRYKTPGLLKIHIRTHTGERPFQCTWKDCGMHFISTYSLAKHCITHGSISGYSIQSVPCDK